MNRISIYIVFIFMVTSCVSSQSARLDKDLSRFVSWFSGEYDNYEQVWLDEGNDLDFNEKHEHIHHIFKRVSAPNIGNYVFFVKQYLNGDYEKVYRQRLYSFQKNVENNVIQLTIYRFKNEKKHRYSDKKTEQLISLSHSELTTIKGCEVFWRFNGSLYEGFMKENACKFYSKNLKQYLTITDSLRLSDNAIWISDKAFDTNGNLVFGKDTPHVNKKVRYFKGWMGIKREKFDVNAKADDWIFMRDFSIHNGGQILPIIDKDGLKTGYSVQLAQLTYQNTQQPILKLALIDDSSGKSITYTWTETQSRHIGMNLGWMQVGLTAM